MSSLKKIIGLFALSCIFTFNAAAQCKSLVKKNLPRLAPFTHNGQMNSVSLPEGGVADFKLSCYTGMTYRIALCADEILGKVTFKVLDEDNNEVYNSADNNNATTWDFNVGASQELTIEISAPLSKNQIKGCAAVLIGFKEPRNVGGLR